MSKTLVCIQSYGAARDRVHRHWPLYKRSGCDILGVNTKDTPHDWPEDCLTVDIGRDGYLDNTDHLCRRMLATLEYLLVDPKFTGYTHFMLMEHDSIFVKNLPPLSAGLTTPFPGFCPESWKKNSPWFIHFPWIMDRVTASLLLDAGHCLLERGIFDGGTPDAFLGSMIVEAGEKKIQWNKFPQDKTVFSVNSGSFSEGEAGDKLRISFQQAFRLDPTLFFLHGLKSQEEFEYFSKLIS